MDTNFVEFWADLFRKAAQNRKTTEYFETWMRQGFTGMEEMTALFQKSCGLDPHPQQPGQEYFVFWERAQEGFKKFLTDYLALLGSVPREDYLELVSKYEAMKEKVSSQEDTIRSLQMLLTEQKKAEHEAMQGKVHDLVLQQAEQFQHLMSGFAQGFKAEEPQKHEKKKK